jgi:hypothetical protein
MYIKEQRMRNARHSLEDIPVLTEMLFSGLEGIKYSAIHVRELQGKNII